MSSVEMLIHEARRLQPSELEELRGAIDEMLAGGNRTAMSEDEFERDLAAKGVITLPAPMTDEELAREIAEEEAWEPIKVEGKPLSEMIIEERR